MGIPDGEPKYAGKCLIPIGLPYCANCFYELSFTGVKVVVTESSSGVVLVPVLEENHPIVVTAETEAGERETRLTHLVQHAPCSAEM